MGENRDAEPKRWLLPSLWKATGSRSAGSASRRGFGVFLHEPHTGSLMDFGVFLLCTQGWTSHGPAPCSVVGLQAVCWYICKLGTEFLALTPLLDKEQWGLGGLCVRQRRLPFTLTFLHHSCRSGTLGLVLRSLHPGAEVSAQAGTAASSPPAIGAPAP